MQKEQGWVLEWRRKWIRYLDFGHFSWEIISIVKCMTNFGLSLLKMQNTDTGNLVLEICCFFVMVFESYSSIVIMRKCFGIVRSMFLYFFLSLQSFSLSPSTSSPFFIILALLRQLVPAALRSHPIIIEY